jgi:hypothetical protein
MTAVWFAPEEELTADDELDKVLEVAALLVRLERNEVLLVEVLDAAEPLPEMKYPPTPATTNTMTITKAATVVEMAVLEGRRLKTPRGEDPSPPNLARRYLTLGLESVPTSTRDVYRPFHP